MQITIEHLTHTYMAGGPFEKKALDDVSLTVPNGQFLAIIGHTGSGKSTLIQHLNGLLKPTEGKITIGETDITEKNVKLKQIRSQVGLVFQYPEYQLFEETVFRDIAFGPKNMGLSEQEVKERVHEALHVVGLSEAMLEKSPFELSGGQKRRVAIACVLAMRPNVLILDEPTAGLDPMGRDEILFQIHSLFKRYNMTVILVSHSMEDVARFAKRIVVMDNGKIALDGTPAQVFRNVAYLEQIGLSVPQITKVMRAL
ncbi:MAG: energy-coupling factor transporter ATPase, partial [Hyphomonadaceae bacterium]|nr:energy-coupling factor transporter ATPase [Clostridia bacterium]